MLPEDADKHEDGRDEDEGEGDLADGTRGERLDVDVGARDLVVLIVPAGKGGEEDEGEEGEDDGYDPASQSANKLLCINRETERRILTVDKGKRRRL